MWIFTFVQSLFNRDISFRPVMAVERELAYTKRERTFAAWSCILG
jgi:hypothetical protein